MTSMLANTDPALRSAWHVVARSNEVKADRITIELRRILADLLRTA